MAGEGEGRRREGGEGPSEEADFSEYVEYLKKKYGEAGIGDDDAADRPREKDSAQTESEEDSSKRSAENHPERPGEKNEVKEGDAGQLEGKDEGGRDEALEWLKELIKEIYEREAEKEKHDLDQERRNPGNGPVGERAQDDVREKPQALSERLSRESEAPQQPESGSPRAGIGENRTDPVGESESQGDIRQGLEQDVRVSIESSAAADWNVASGAIEGKIESSDNEGPTEAPRETGSVEPLQPGIPKGPDGLGGAPGIGSEIHERRVESSEGQPYRDENVVSSREVAHANEELRPTREAPQGWIDSSPFLTAAKLEEHKASNAEDGGGFQREAGKEPLGNVESPALSEDLKALRKLQSDAALPEAIELRSAMRKEARPEDTPAIVTGADGRGLKEDLGERRVVLDRSSGNTDSINLRADIFGNKGFYRKEIVDLDKVTEPSQGGKDTRFLGGDTARIESDSRPYVPYARKGPFEVGDSIPVKANLTGVPPHIRLDVLKSHIESVTGVEIDRYKLYEIKGSVKGAYDFDIYRTVGKYVYLAPSLEQRAKVQPGRVYDVGIKSVVEVPLTDAQREILGGPKKRGAWRSTMYKINHSAEGDRGRATMTDDKGKEGQTKRPESILPEKVENINATFTSEARLHKWSKPRCQFNINGSEFERKTGVTVEEMRDYVLKGRIDGVGEFQKTLHRCAAGQHIPIYIPAKLHDKIEPGRTYQVTIDSIEKLPPRKNPWEGSEEADSIRWTWREVASWVDAEGWIGGNPKRGGYHEVYVCQKERKMLEGLGRFLESEGFHPKLILNRHDGVYRLHVSGAEQAARVIKNIEPFIRTVRKKEEIANFKESIVRPRKNLWPSIRIAREILGLTEN